MSPRTGRPKSDNAKDLRIGVRLDKETIEKLDAIAENNNESRSSAIRRCIENEYKGTKK